MRESDTVTVDVYLEDRGVMKKPIDGGKRHGGIQRVQHYFGARSTRTVSCSTSSFSHGGMPKLPNASFVGY
jgi:hypothetical protein